MGILDGKVAIVTGAGQGLGRVEALELARREKPDMVVTDYQMPVMSGLELVKELREDDQTKDVPAILLTARSFAITKDQQKELEISACLSKPFSPKELLGYIEDILYQKELVTDN